MEQYQPLGLYLISKWVPPLTGGVQTPGGAPYGPSAISSHLVASNLGPRPHINISIITQALGLNINVINQALGLNINITLLRRAARSMLSPEIIISPLGICKTVVLTPKYHLEIPFKFSNLRKMAEFAKQYLKPWTEVKWYAKYAKAVISIPEGFK